MKLEEIRKRARSGARLAGKAPVRFWGIPCPEDMAVADMGDMIQADLRKRWNTEQLWVLAWIADNDDGMTQSVRARVYNKLPPLQHLDISHDYSPHDPPPEGHVAELLVNEPEGGLLYGVEVGTMETVRKAVLGTPKAKRKKLFKPAKCDECDEPAHTALAGIGRWCKKHWEAYDAASRKRHGTPPRGVE